MDERGRTAHVGNFEAQVHRMLRNISGLLEQQGASFRDIVSAISHLKNPRDAGRYTEIISDRGFMDLPHAQVRASVCRPDLLCEMEAIALLPRAV